MSETQNYWMKKVDFQRNRAECYFKHACVLASIQGCLEVTVENEAGIHSKELVEFAERLLKQIDNDDRAIEEMTITTLD